MFDLAKNDPPGFRKLDWVGATAVLLNPPGLSVDVFPKMLLDYPGVVVVPNAGIDVEAPKGDYVGFVGVLNIGLVVVVGKVDDAFYLTKPNPVGTAVGAFCSPNGFAFYQFIVAIIK